MSESIASQTNHVDVLIVGAGISGIGTAYHLQKQCPDRTYAIVEGRADLGGTWDLFRYPGVRSDSDMHTLGFSFKPWKEAKSIADGPSILKYVRETAQENGIDKNIRFHHQVKTASWSSETATWTVTVVRQDTNETLVYTCNFLSMCAGYYSYKEGYTPEFAGRDSFKGHIVHPQKWPKDLDYSGKRVVIIGSGATAVTLVPAIAETAAHVTMLQRSPTYIVARPDHDAIADKLRKVTRRIRDEEGSSILYTSHNMRDVEEVCDRVIFLHKGRIVAEGTPGQIVQKFAENSLEDVFIKIARSGDIEE